MMKKNSLLLAIGLACLCQAAAALNVPAGAESAVITLPDGFKVSAELALTPEAQQKGLMFRNELPAGRGMLFVFGETAPRSFWMKNTWVDLDMVFLDRELTVLRVFHRVPRSVPGQSDSEVARAQSPAAMVLELSAGAARSHKLKPGSRLKISFPKK